MSLYKDDPAGDMQIECYYCRQRIALLKMPGGRKNRSWYTIDHICMSETAKAKRFPQLDEELQKLRAFRDAAAKANIKA